MILLRIKDAFLKNTKKVFLLKFLFVTDLHDLFKLRNDKFFV